MKHRVIWKMLLLSIVTLGIYRLYWFIKTRREMMELNPNIKIMSPAILFIPVIIIIATLVAFIVITVHSVTHTQYDCTTDNYARSLNVSSDTGVSQTCKGNQSAAAIGLLYLAFFVAYIIFVIWEWSYAQGVGIITNNKLSFAMSIIVLVLVPDGIDILIIQDSFNKLTPTDLQPQQGPPANPINYAAAPTA